jgi:hypothetical protein
MRVGLRYVLLCDIGWEKWALSIGLALCIMYINSRQMCALTFAGQRKCGTFGIVVPSAVLCVVIIVSTVVLTTNISTVW